MIDELDRKQRKPCGDIEGPGHRPDPGWSRLAIDGRKRPQIPDHGSKISVAQQVVCFRRHEDQRATIASDAVSDSAFVVAIGVIPDPTPAAGQVCRDQMPHRKVIQQYLAAVVVTMADSTLPDNLDQVLAALQANRISSGWHRGIGEAVRLQQVMRGNGVERGEAHGTQRDQAEQCIAEPAEKHHRALR
jgi:hypothetical protein